MAEIINISGKNPMDTARKKEALEYLANNATTEELQKLMNLSKNPMYRKMLNSMN